MDSPQKRDQEPSIPDRADEEVLVRNFGCLAPPGINNDQLSSALLQRLGAVLEIRDSPSAAVGGHGIAAHDDHRFGAINIGHGPKPAMAIEPKVGDLMRHLIERACREHGLGAQRLFQIARSQYIGVIMRIGIADIKRG